MQQITLITRVISFILISYTLSSAKMTSTVLHKNKLPCVQTALFKKECRKKKKYIYKSSSFQKGDFSPTLTIIGESIKSCVAPNPQQTKSHKTDLNLNLNNGERDVTNYNTITVE